MSGRSRRLATRRDRRKAKASDWRRQGKPGMGARVGHGPGGSAGHVGATAPVTSSAPPQAAPLTVGRWVAPALRVTLADLAGRRRKKLP